MNIFVSSPQSRTGKTFISAGLVAIMQALGYRCAYYKPIQLGADENYGFKVCQDVTFVKNIDPYVDCICSYSFHSLATPMIASELENIKIDTKIFQKDYKNISSKNDCTVIEGLDGLLLPIIQKFNVADLVKLLDLPVLFVINPQISNIESILASINQAKQLDLTTVGVILNKFPFHTNDQKIKSYPRIIEEYSEAKILGIVEQFSTTTDINPPKLISTLLNSIDVEKIFNIPI